MWTQEILDVQSMVKMQYLHINFNNNKKLS